MKISDATHYKGVPFAKGTFIGSPCCDWIYCMRKGAEIVFDPCGREKIYECNDCKKLFSLQEIETNMRKVRETCKGED